MKFLLLIASVLLPLFSPSSAHPVNLEVHESLYKIPSGWVQGKAPSPSKLLQLRLAVRQSRAAEFEQHVVDISTPGHDSYGRFLSREELKNSLRPQPQVSTAIFQWLNAARIPTEDINNDGDWINFVVSVGKAEKMMDTRFYYYHNQAHNLKVIRTLRYSIPRSLRESIQMIQPTTRFGVLRPQMSLLIGGEIIQNKTFPSGYDRAFCNHTITPACIRGMYGLGNFTGDPSLGNKLGISGYLEQWARSADLGYFYDQFTNYTKADNFSVVSISGGLNTQNSGQESGEANLDVQYALSLSHGTPSVYYTTGGLGQLIPDLDQPGSDASTNEPYLDQLHYLLSLSDDELPTVLTTSYGEDEQSVPEPYTNATCSLFAQLGARGVSVIFSSGDTGVGSACQTNDGKNTTRFLPIFPAACPFVTSVGGTYNIEPERAAHFSSGGFSDRFPRPSYQDAAVAAYLNQLGDRWDGLYNCEGRGFPDVAAQSVNFSVFDQGVLKSYQGTSCASPVFAAVVANLNSIRMGTGMPPLGFLNPWLYSHGYKGLTDIVDGGSTGCIGYDQYSFLPTPRVEGASWNATTGWDPVTGLGTPNFEKMVEMMFSFDRPGTAGNGTGNRPLGRPRFVAGGVS